MMHALSIVYHAIGALVDFVFTMIGCLVVLKWSFATPEKFKEPICRHCGFEMKPSPILGQMRCTNCGCDDYP
jgi:hypothetical protein